MKYILTVLCICASLLGCSQDVLLENEETGNEAVIVPTNVQEVKHEKVLSDELDLKEALNAVNEYMEDILQHDFDENSMLYKVDLTNDGIEDALFVSSEFGPVGTVINESGTYSVIDPFVYTDKYSTFRKSGNFLIESIERPSTEMSVYKAINIYWYDGNQMKALLENPLIVEHKDIENYLIGEMIEGSGSINKSCGYNDFTYSYSSIYHDRRGNEHSFKDIEIHYVFEEELGTYVTEINKDNSTAEYASEISSRLDFTGSNEDLKSFEEMYENEDLESALWYYWNNQYDFTKSDKAVYIERAYNAVVKFPKNTNQDPLIQDSWAYFETLLNQFDSETMTLHDFNIEDVVGEKEATVFSLVYTYFATEGHIDEHGSLGLAVLDKELAKVIKVIAYDYDAYVHGIYLTDINFETIDEVINYPVAYPNVVIESVSELKEFNNEEIWKTTIIIPVNIENQSEQQHKVSEGSTISAGSAHAMAVNNDGSL